MSLRQPVLRATTILTVRRGAKVALGGDGQVSLGPTVIKHDAVKVRRLADGAVLAGFAGAAADAFSLLDRFEARLKDSRSNLRRAAVELAKLWRTDRVLRRLESQLVVADATSSLLVSGTGDVIEPTDGVIGIGSGGAFAASAAHALLAHTTLAPVDIVRESLKIAGRVCIYSNEHLTIEEIA